MHGHMSTVGEVAMSDPSLFWELSSEINISTMKTNDYWCTFKPTKKIKIKV